ncbi:beta strand repeat-containing protein [Cohnella herbarum]|uniref:Cadherin-like beta-sandwich-like domain-containing protein n=1 Tax=Cohnella herbarum TaxID=2728023 RepID=A0A7Z2VK70_9BACL|nr:cadherin-like beta sandwich domain-containing protein [Cohnella herbarum]QJD84602.1 hypothetical protein HH215_16390 [Cohnella herbarum]
MISKKRRLFRATVLLLIGAMVAALFPVSEIKASSSFAGGDGTPGNPYLIADPEQFDAIRSNPSAAYKLVADIDLSVYATADGGRGWVPIPSFGGSLDGDGHRIIGLVVNRGDSSRAGLFAYIGGGSVSRLIVADAQVTGNNDSGILAGTIYFGNIDNVYTSGQMSGGGIIGGLAGDVQDTSVSFSGSSVVVSGTDTVGGLIGQFGAYNVSTSSITDSFAEGNVQGTGDYVGGLIGMTLGGTIERSYASGTVEGVGSIGGLLGRGNGSILRDSYAAGSVSGASVVGGLIGSLYEVAFVNCYAVGAVTGDATTGGFGGYDYQSTYERNYWDPALTGQQYGFGYSADFYAATALTEVNRYNAASYSGWDFGGTWADPAGTGYPVLSNNAPMRLAALTAVPDNGTTANLTPAFQSGILQYAVSVASDVASLTFAATAANAGSAIQTTGGTSLLVGDNAASVTVSDPLGIRTPRTYGITIRKLSSSALSSDARLTDLKVDGVAVAGFDSDTHAYTVNAPSTTTSVNVTATTSHPDSTYTVTGGGSLSFGNNAVVVTVTSSDGTVLTYTLTVVRSPFAGGDGTAASPYLVETAQQFDKIRETDYYQKDFRLIADIDLSSFANWDPMYLEGTLDGGGHRITGLKINRPNQDDVGLFNYIYDGAVNDLRIVGANVVGRDQVGILSGWLTSFSASGIHVSGTVKGRNYVGGAFGLSYGPVSSSSSIAEVTGSGNQVGGLVGQNFGIVTESFAEGAVKGAAQVGGLIGYDNGGTITNSFATGAVTATGATAGGLIGDGSSGTYTDNYATGKVQASSAAGGFTGKRTGADLQRNYWNTTTSGKSNGAGTGSSSGMTGLTTAAMKQQSSFASWDFATVWTIAGGKTTPYLQSKKPLGLTDMTVTASTGDAVSVAPSVDNLNSSYSTTVPGSATSVTVTGTPLDSADAVTVIGGTNLISGSNAVTVRLTSANGIDKRDYALEVIRADPSDAGLSALTLSAGSLNPAFAKATITYNVSVPIGTSVLKVTPTVSGAGSTVTVNGADVSSGQASQDLALAVGNTTVTIVVNSADETASRTYTLTVNRPAGSSNANLSALTTTAGSLSPTFSGTVTSYSTPSVGNSTSSVTVRPTVADSTATIKVSVNGGTAVSVNSGSNSSNLALKVGTNNIVVTVTAQDGTTKDYEISVVRSVTLTGLTLSSGTLNPAFGANTTSYAASVGNGVSSLTVRPTTTSVGATISASVNGGTAVSVSSGQNSSPLPLNTGTNTVDVIVTSGMERFPKRIRLP